MGLNVAVADEIAVSIPLAASAVAAAPSLGIFCSVVMKSRRALIEPRGWCEPQSLAAEAASFSCPIGTVKLT